MVSLTILEMVVILILAVGTSVLLLLMSLQEAMISRSSDENQGINDSVSAVRTTSSVHAL